jgi:hypothetical protein
LDSCQAGLEKLKGGRQQTNTQVIENVYFTMKVDNKNRTGLIERWGEAQAQQYIDIRYIIIYGTYGSRSPVSHRPAAVLPSTKG